VGYTHPHSSLLYPAPHPSLCSPHLFLFSLSRSSYLLYLNFSFIPHPSALLPHPFVLLIAPSSLISHYSLLLIFLPLSSPLPPSPATLWNSSLLSPGRILPTYFHLMGVYSPPPTWRNSTIPSSPAPLGGILPSSHLDGILLYYPSYLIGFSPNSTRWDSAASLPDGILPLALLVGFCR
jgi:hypothetical protein